MGRKPFKSAEEKLQVVLGVLKGEMTQVSPSGRSSSSKGRTRRSPAARTRRRRRAGARPISNRKTTGLKATLKSW